MAMCRSVLQKLNKSNLLVFISTFELKVILEGIQTAI